MATLSLRQSSKNPMPPPWGPAESPGDTLSGARTQENIMMSFSLVWCDTVGQVRGQHRRHCNKTQQSNLIVQGYPLSRDKYEANQSTRRAEGKRKILLCCGPADAPFTQKGLDWRLQWMGWRHIYTHTCERAQRSIDGGEKRETNHHKCNSAGDLQLYACHFANPPKRKHIDVLSILTTTHSTQRWIVRILAFNFVSPPLKTVHRGDLHPVLPQAGVPYASL